MNDSGSNIPKSFKIIAIVALIWNVLGVMSFVMQMLMSDETIAALPEEQQALFEASPSWMPIVFGIAVFGGTLGCVGLLMKKAWTVPVFLVSLVAIVIQMGYGWCCTNGIEVMGVLQGLILPALVVLIAIYLYYYSKQGKTKGWLS